MNWLQLSKTASQEGWSEQFGEVQRFALDAYRCNVYLTKTSHKLAVSVSVNHDMFGLNIYQEFWKYELNEDSSARSTYNKAKTIVAEIFDEFQITEEPNLNLHSRIREAVRDLDKEHKPTTRVPWINAARDVEGVSDWRKSLYGTRYPEIGGY